MIDVASIKESNASKIPSFDGRFTLSNACLIASDIIVLLRVCRMLVIMVRILINHGNLIFCGNPRHHVDVVVILPIRERKVCVFWHINIVSNVRPSQNIFEGINFDVEFAKEDILIKKVVDACLK
jgi:hypothetical protein